MQHIERMGHGTPCLKDLFGNAAVERCLKHILPQIESLPDVLKGNSLRTCMKQYLPNVTEQDYTNAAQALAQI